jgi:hypothetical protein
VDFVTIDPIRYQVALVEVPPEEAEEVEARSGIVANADQIMSIRPQSFFHSEPVEDGGDVLPDDEGLDTADFRPAVAAILDGYPMENHQLLAGRVEVEEVDITAATVPVNRRYHGTAIASLILHGDLAAGEEPLSRKLKAVPILAAPQGLGDERLDSDYLPIGLIYRAVKSLKVGLDGAEPTGPEVILINHSICDAEGAFVRRPSVWARLLDWMSVQYGVLFVVSAGNITREFPTIVDQNGQRKFWRGVKNVAQPHPDDMRRGTITHFVLEGENSTAFTDAQGLFVGVQARALNPSFRDTPIPYALAITLEIAATVQEDIYETVATAIRPRARV